MRYTLSPAGLAFIQKCEGFRGDPLSLGDGRWLVGHGHVRTGGPGAKVSRSEALGLLALDLAPVEQVINASVVAELTQSQYDALAAFVFSVGADAFSDSAVLQRLNANDLAGAARAMGAWSLAGASAKPAAQAALIRRRAAEATLFLKDFKMAPSAVLRPQRFSNEASTDIGARLTAILASEEATRAVLDARPTQADPTLEADELTTAHAKPVARELTPQLQKTPIKRAPVGLAFEAFALLALMAFGLALVIAGTSILINGSGGIVDVIGAAALMAPGGAAALTCAIAMRRGPDLAV